MGINHSDLNGQYLNLEADDIAAGAVDTSELAADAVDGTKIADDAISVEHLDTGVTPSHVVKYAAEVTWTGSGASISTTVTGVLTSDIIVAQIHTAPTQAAYIKSCVTVANGIQTTLSAANTSNDAVISYSVLRAVV